MTRIAAAAATILAAPAPVFVIDTCSFIDLFRHDDSKKWQRVPSDEIRAAVELLSQATSSPKTAHLVVPELIPKEFSDNTRVVLTSAPDWPATHDAHQRWLFDTAGYLGVAFPTHFPIAGLYLPDKLRRLAEQLLTHAVVLARDQACLDRAVERVIEKDRPSHKKEIKDSMNLEQSLELGRLLKAGQFGPHCLFVSSNTNDFASASTSPDLHPDLERAFHAAELLYSTSLRAALGRLRSPK